MPIFYECDRCTACCRWPGQVLLTEAEITRIAAFLQIDERDFIAHYTKLNLGRVGLVLSDQPNGACVFLSGNDCQINPVKPQQCRDFPNLWNFPGFEKVCRAKARELTPDEWRQQIKEVTGREVEIGH